MNNKMLITGIAMMLAASVQAQVLYDGGNLATASDWVLLEATAPGVDTSPRDGLLDAPANSGPIKTTDGKTGWQLNDQNADGGFNLPQFTIPLNPARAAELANEGFTLLMEVENVGTGGGLWFGFDGDSPFGSDDSRVAFAGAGDVAANGKTHLLTLIWDPGPSVLSISIDGGAATALTLTANSNNAYTGPDDGSAMILIDSGSSSGTSARWNLVRAEFYKAPDRSLDLILIQK